jgi:hypothetical protein
MVLRIDDKEGGHQRPGNFRTEKMRYSCDRPHPVRWLVIPIQHFTMERSRLGAGHVQRGPWTRLVDWFAHPRLIGP